MVYLITFFVTQSWSWEITNILHLWGMARPMKCYQYYYTIPNDIVPEENCHVKKYIYSAIPYFILHVSPWGWICFYCRRPLENRM